MLKEGGLFVISAVSNCEDSGCLLRASVVGARHGVSEGSLNLSSILRHHPSVLMLVYTPERLTMDILYAYDGLESSNLEHASERKQTRIRRYFISSTPGCNISLLFQYYILSSSLNMSQLSVL